MRHALVIGIVLGLLSGSAHAARPQRYALSAKGRQHALEAWRAYRHSTPLPNGRKYGDSVRHLDLSNKTSQQIWETCMARGFRFEVTVLRRPDGTPIEHEGRTIPLYLFTHPDGGTVRLKPDGDPTSKWMKQPHLVKSLRWPYDASGDGFQHEALKVANNGDPLPRNAREMMKRKRHPQVKRQIARWAARAHTDVVPAIPNPYVK